MHKFPDGCIRLAIDSNTIRESQLFEAFPSSEKTCKRICFPCRENISKKEILFVFVKSLYKTFTGCFTRQILHLIENSIHALRQKVIFMRCRNSLRSDTEIVWVSGNPCCRSTVLALCDNNALPRGISLSEFRKDITNEMRNRGRTAEANIRLHLHLTRREISFSGKHRRY